VDVVTDGEVVVAADAVVELTTGEVVVTAGVVVVVAAGLVDVPADDVDDSTTTQRASSDHRSTLLLANDSHVLCLTLCRLLVELDVTSPARQRT
jgi:hypothetical protein